MGRAAMNAQSLVPRRVTPAAEVKTFGTREKALKTASFERRRDGAILQNGAYDSGGDDPVSSIRASREEPTVLGSSL